MNTFMDKDFLLNTATARELYHGTAEHCPIIDYHCHLSPREIAENIRYDNLTQLWLGGDHYKWRLMRSAGVPERCITGNASDYDKFLCYARVLGRAIGHPLYHWSHLELRRFFHYEGTLDEDTAPQVWALANARLRYDDFSSRGLILSSGVRILCTTDDPIQPLTWHEQLAADTSFPVTVLPTWRLDQALNIEKPSWPDYIRRLGAAAGKDIASFDDLTKALHARMDDFAAHGCKLSDHGLGRMIFDEPSDPSAVETIFSLAMAGKRLSDTQTRQYQTALLCFAAGEYHDRGWVMQLHYGCRRDNHPPMLRALGPDTGFDCVDDHASSAALAALLGRLANDGHLPRTIVYSLNAPDNAAIDSVAGCFQGDAAVSYIQHGSAWWFNDHFDGMCEHLRSLASQGYLAGFIGMLTDSRSFLSYSRHEYFRRILCRLMGQWVEEGFFPDRKDVLQSIVSNICYHNARRYFGFEEKQPSA